MSTSTAGNTGAGKKGAGHVTDVFVILGSTIIRRLHKLTLPYQGQLTLRLTLGPSDLVYRLLTGPPLLEGRGRGKYFYRGLNPLPAAQLVNIRHKTVLHIFQRADTSSIWK